MKILFISHDLSRTGAPNMLLQLIKWYKKNTNNSIDLVGLKGGDFFNEFSSICDNITIIEDKPKSFKVLLSQKVLKKIGIKSKTTKQLVLDVLCENNYDLIYGNTALSLSFSSRLRQRLPRTKLILHVHEMEVMIKRLSPNFKKYVSNVDKFIAASNPVKENLKRTYKIPSNNIKVINEFSEFELPQAINKQNDNTFVVGASGLSGWRKGNDVFLQIARIIKKKYPDANIKFIWVGNESSDKLIIDADIKKLNLSKTVSFIGSTDKPIIHYNNFNLFLLTSREDPFPLVCIEVAKLGKPIICFKDASGTAEIIENGGGKVVPYLDIESMANEIIGYYKDRVMLKRDSIKVKELFSVYTADKICPLIQDEINNLIRKS
ncbi:glycosyltransferase [Seonamhaeicola maritimus]|uniref:glycosyltransferase n=1 Tax=Seonamhaeicola maritimus TaxID=2591822 RepID=UPI002494E5B6|nr:glycosyltransferase [Seonamhaeicola maritimus]